jgi:hypothetical protein
MVGRRLLIKISHKPGSRVTASATMGVSGPALALTLLFEVPPAARTGLALSDDAAREHRWYLAELRGQLALDQLSDVNDWDVAHRIISDALGMGADAKVLSVEPDIEQAWPITPPPSTPGPPIAALAPCEPDPQKGDPLPPGPGFAWHLGKRFSTLQEARNAVMNSGSDVTIVHLDTGFDPAHKTVPQNIDKARQRNFVETNLAVNRPCWQIAFIGRELIWIRLALSKEPASQKKTPGDAITPGVSNNGFGPDNNSIRQGRNWQVCLGPCQG